MFQILAFTLNERLALGVLAKSKETTSYFLYPQSELNIKHWLNVCQETEKSKKGTQGKQ